MANARSGMAVHDECKMKFLELKAKRTYRFIVYKIEEKQNEVIVEKLGQPTDSYEDFSASLPANECRYAVYDFDYVTEENCGKSRIIFVAWSPDTAKVRSKMIYASSKDTYSWTEFRWSCKLLILPKWVSMLLGAALIERKASSMKRGSSIQSVLHSDMFIAL